MRALPELDQTESPDVVQDARADYVAPSPRAHPSPRAAQSAPASDPKPRPRSVALGHESDRNVRRLRLRDRAGTIRIGDVDFVEDDQPQGGDQNEDRDRKKDGDVEGKDNERSHDDPVETTSPTELSQPATSPNGTTQFATSTLSPNRGTFADSPSEVSEFDPNVTSAPKRDSLSAPSPFQSPASKNGTLPSPATRSAPLSPSLRRGTISTPGSRKATLSPLVRPAFLHPPHVVSDAPRTRRTTFADQAPPPHAHGHANGHGEGHGLGIHSRRAMLRARNGTITSPMTPYSHLPTHAENEPEMMSPSSNGTDLRSPPPAHHKHPHSPHAPHIPHPHMSGHYGPGYSEYRRPRAHTGQGGLPSPFALAAQWGVSHVPAVRRFVGEHEREVAKEEVRPRRMSVYQRVDSDPTQHGTVAAGDASPRDIDEVSLEDDELEQMGGDEYNALVVLSWIVAGHYLLHHAIAFVILAPYSAKVSLIKD
ncbi:hypothetical protein FRC07_013225, partial [Ceratobasidium sp. 392]